VDNSLNVIIVTNDTSGLKVKIFELSKEMKKMCISKHSFSLTLNFLRKKL